MPKWIWLHGLQGQFQVHFQSQNAIGVKNEDVVKPAAALGIIKIGSLEMPKDITRVRVHIPLFYKEGLDNTDNISSFFCNNIWPRSVNITSIVTFVLQHGLSEMCHI